MFLYVKEILLGVSRKELREDMSRKEFKDLLNKKSIKPKPTPIIDELENSSQNYKPKKISGAFNGKYIECKIDSNEKLSIEKHFKKIKKYVGNIIDNLKASGE